MLRSIVLSLMLMDGVSTSTSVGEAQEVDTKSSEKQKQVPHVKEELSLASVIKKLK